MGAIQGTAVGPSSLRWSWRATQLFSRTVSMSCFAKVSIVLGHVARKFTLVPLLVLIVPSVPTFHPSLLMESAAALMGSVTAFQLAWGEVAHKFALLQERENPVPRNPLLPKRHGQVSHWGRAEFDPRISTSHFVFFFASSSSASYSSVSSSSFVSSS